MNPIWIEFVDSGIANRFSFEDYELIEINKRIVNYPRLYRSILKHELEHKDGKYKPHDFIHDFKSKTPGLHKFMRDNPSTWIQLLPIYWSKSRRQIVYDFSTLSQWIIVVAICTLTFITMRWIL